MFFIVRHSVNVFYCDNVGTVTSHSDIKCFYFTG
jgi:hypothetical protein